MIPVGADSFKELGVDPFRSYKASELDALVEAKRQELTLSLSKAQVVLQKKAIQEAINALPSRRKDLDSPECRAKAQEEVLSIITGSMQQYLFHRLDGTDVFFDDQADAILELAKKKGWNALGPEALDHLKGVKKVSKNDFKDVRSDTAFRTLSMLGTDDLVAWTNKAIDGLYVEGGSEAPPDKVTDSTSFTTFKATINTIASRAQKLQKNPHYKDAEKYSAVLKKLTPMFADEKTYKAFRTAAVMYSVESEIQSSVSVMGYRDITALVNSKIAGRGIDVEEALRELERFCLSKGIIADFSKVSKEYDVCGFCGCRFQVDGETNFCPYCNKPVAVSCPRCGVRNPSSSIHCKGCGIDFSFISGMPFAEKGLKEDLANGNLLSVKAALARFEGYEDFVDKALIRDAKAFVKDTEGLLAELDSLEGSKRYCAAVKKCDDYLRLHPGQPDIKGRRDRCNEVVEDVGRRFSAVPKGSERMYIDLVALCSDHPGLLEYFKSNRPSPPSRADVSKSEDGNVLVSMGSPPPADTTYLIIRKKGSSPLNEKDGDQVAETRDRELVDRGISYGTEYRYAVFSKRWGVVSSSAALSGPITVFADVIDLSASPAEEGIRLDFKVPRGCTRALVFRKEGADPEASGAPYADNGTKQFFVDKEAKDGDIVYHYRVAAEYSEGRAVPYRTSGAVVRCRPRPPPKPVSDLSVSSGGGRFIARYTSPEEAELFISDPSRDLGMSSCTTSELERVAKRLSGVVKNRDGVYTFSLPSGTVGIVYAVIASGGTSIIGNGAFVSTLADVSNVRTAMDGDVCSLTFIWPPGCDRVKVAMRSDRPPEGASDFESDSVILLEKYVRDGNARIKLPFQRTYMKLYSVYGSKGMSQGFGLTLSSRGDIPEIRYTFAYAFLGRKCTCKITVSGDLKSNPAMV
ncbi:MAG: zinc ribbon domain-containing protein, partial [Candidatus Methanomethylophilaceae archaeon]|nr:zinc ribbon domain-containing protein [Candidatus Methanomethylophilaceae archaeon]